MKYKIILMNKSLRMARLMGLSLLMLASACAHMDGPYRGRVVELETGKPIEGAVVAAVWSIEFWINLQKPCDAKEVLTDKNGEFVLPRGICISHPLTVMYDPDVVVFKPGYLGYPPLGANMEQRWRYMPNFTGDEFKDKNKYYLIELGRTKTRSEREDAASNASIFHDDWAYDKMPRLLNAINMEYEALGYGKIGPRAGGEE